MLYDICVRVFEHLDSCAQLYLGPLQAGHAEVENLGRLLAANHSCLAGFGVHRRPLCGVGVDRFDGPPGGRGRVG